jgi:hypothetical protein
MVLAVFDGMSARRCLALWLAVVAAGVSAAACGRPTDAVSSELKRQLASGRPSNVTPAIWTAVQEFYTQREWSPAWVTDEAPSKRVNSAIRVLSSAEAHGLDAADYGTALLTRRNTELAATTDAPERARELAAFDARLTSALLTLGRDVSIGRASPAGIDRRPRSRRKSPDLAATPPDWVRRADWFLSPPD